MFKEVITSDACEVQRQSALLHAFKKSPAVERAARPAVTDLHNALRMIEIAPARLLPLATLLSLALAAAIGTAVVIATCHLRDRTARLTMVAVVAGFVLGAASAVFRSSRDAGTGTHTAWGWPRAVYTRWVSWETSQRTGGSRLRGVAENAVFYATLAALVGSVGLASSQLRIHNNEEPT